MYRLPTAILPLSLCLAAACGSSSPTGPGQSPQPGNVTIVRGASLLTTTAFDPNPEVLSLAGGARVRWVNGDGGTGYGGGVPVTHQIASDDGAFPTSGPLGVGETYAVTLTKTGTYRYHCAIHPTMVGTITVEP
jgi:plastocyanin